MTQFLLLREGKLNGLVDITNKGFKIAGDRDFGEQFDKMASDFERTDLITRGNEIDYSFAAIAPTQTMVEMLFRVKSDLELLGYKILI